MRRIPKVFYIFAGMLITIVVLGLVIVVVTQTMAQDDVIYLPFIQSADTFVQSSNAEAPPPTHNDPPKIEDVPPLTQEELDALRNAEEAAKKERGEEDKIIQVQDIRTIRPNGVEIQLPESVIVNSMGFITCSPIHPQERCAQSPIFELTSEQSTVVVDNAGFLFIHNHSNETDETRRQQLIERDKQAFRFLIDILGEDKVYVPKLPTSPSTEKN